MALSNLGFQIAVLLEDAIDHPLNFRRDDAAELMDLSILRRNLFDSTIPDSLCEENRVAVGKRE